MNRRRIFFKWSAITTIGLIAGSQMINMLFSGCRDTSREFNIDRDNAGQLCILLDESPAASAELAARELQFHIQKSMGIELPVIKGELPEDKLPVCVGESSFTRSLGLDAGEFEDQEYVIRINSSYIVLAGKDQEMSTDDALRGRDTNFRTENGASVFDYGKANGNADSEKLIIPGTYELQGTCYAVYDFLERFLGVRWYGPHPDNIVIPGHVSLQLPPFDIKRSPALKHRTGTGFGGTMNRDLFFNPSPEMYQLYDRRMRVGEKNGDVTIPLQVLWTAFSPKAKRSRNCMRFTVLSFLLLARKKVNFSFAIPIRNLSPRWLRMHAIISMVIHLREGR